MKQVTIKDIADIAGVSFSTVSRCLNDSPKVSAKTKAKVMKISQEMGFQFNANARSLVKSESLTIGVVLPKHYMDISVNVYHNSFVNNLQTNIEEKDYDLLITYEKNESNGSNNIIRLVTMKKVDGLILILETPEKETVDFLNKNPIPVVFTHFPPSSNKEIHSDMVFTDHYTGGSIVANLLLKQNLKRFGIINVSDDHREFELRREGFNDTVAKSDAEVKEYFCERTRTATYNLVKENISEFKNMEGLFCMNDLMAIGAMKALLENKIRIPEDIKVIGYDDSEFCKYSTPSLSSVHQPKEDLAFITCERLFYLIKKKKLNEKTEPKKIVIQPLFVERDST